jgi:bifunctional DNA-binding transcriptional regulator/antitoxin component of YhaV-PrlF toxin-antitoxin module
VPRISSKNQLTVPVAALDEAGIHAGDRVVVEPVGEGELRVRRAALTFDSAFGSLTGTYPSGYLDRLDAEERER